MNETVCHLWIIAPVEIFMRQFVITRSHLKRIEKQATITTSIINEKEGWKASVSWVGCPLISLWSEIAKKNFKFRLFRFEAKRNILDAERNENAKNTENMLNIFLSLPKPRYEIEQLVWTAEIEPRLNGFDWTAEMEQLDGTAG